MALQRERLIAIMTRRVPSIRRRLPISLRFAPAACLLLEQCLMRTPVRLLQRRVDMGDSADALPVLAGCHQAGVAQVARQAQVSLHGTQYDVQRCVVKGVGAQSDRRQFGDDEGGQLFVIERQHD